MLQVTSNEVRDLDAIGRLEMLRKLNSNKEWVNQQIYRLLYKEGLYILAYKRLKSKPGNMTHGSDGKTLDGISQEQIWAIIEEMRSEEFQPHPIKKTYIPKANGKLRKLGVPSTRDKVVQEVVRAILEAIYDSPYGSVFSDSSYGFRSGRNCHSALREVQRKWSGVNWIIEGDIHACFDEIDHEILVELVGKKIHDERFLNLIRKFLKAGYFDLEKRYQNNLVGTPQGGIISPILANVYLHELDQFVEQLKTEYEKGELKNPNPGYRALACQKTKLVKEGKTRTKEFRKTLSQMKQIPSLDDHDPNFIRIKYVRYADGWIIGVSGSHQLAEEIKERVCVFLKDKLKLELSQDKTRITSARNEEADFLGYKIRVGRSTESQKVTLSTNSSGRYFKRRSTGWEVVLKVPMDRLIKKLADRGFCDINGNPVSKDGWLNLDEDQIVELFSSINRGIQNYYRPAGNWAEIQRVQYILKFSLAKTLARKRRVAMSKVFSGKDIKITVTRAKGNTKEIKFYRNPNWSKNRDAFMDSPTIDIVRS